MKNIAIIGASSGIGATLAQNLSNEGHKVYGTYNSSTEPPSSSNLDFHHLNVLDDNLDVGFVPEVLDGLVYCPGSINLKPFARIKPEGFIDDFRLQVVGAIKLTQLLLPRLKKSNQGSIVFFSTVAVQQGFNFHTQVSTSKGAIEGLTRALAAELSPAVRVNAIAPSLTNTPLASKLLSTEEKIAQNDKRHPLQRIGKAADLAHMAAFLLSEKSSWMTGQVLKVDGGMSVIKS